MSIQTYKKDIDKLLVDISLTGACYGLVDEVTVISRHLITVPRAKAPAFLANALARIVTKRYADATLFLDDILANPEQAKFHEEANGFKALILKLQGDEDGFKEHLSLAPSFATAFISK